jgi:hypothetical protein
MEQRMTRKAYVYIMTNKPMGFSISASAPTYPRAYLRTDQERAPIFVRSGI